MKRNKKIRNVCLALAAAAALCLTGCGESKAAKQARQQGIDQMESGNYSEAVKSFETALKDSDGIVNKFELDILKYRGEAEFDLADYKASAHTYDILSQVDKGRPEYLFYKAASQALAGDPASALETYKQGASAEGKKSSMTPEESMALSAIGKAYDDSGDYKSAMSFFQNVLNSGKKSGEIYNQIGLCELSAKRYDEAAAAFDKGIALGDADWTKGLMYNKGAALEYKGDYAGALKIFETYVSTYGSTPELTKEITFLKSR